MSKFQNYDYIDQAGTLYIHWNKRHMGRLHSASINFNAKKKEMAALLMKDYTDNFLKNTNISKDTLAALSTTMGTTKEEFITLLDQQIRDSLQKDLNIGNLQKLFNIVNPAKGASLNELAGQLANDKSIRTLNQILDILQQSVSLLEGKKGPIAAAILSAKNANSLTGAGQALSAALNKWSVNNNMKTIKKQALTDAVAQLNNFAHVLQANAEGKHIFKSGSEMSAAGLRTLLSNNLISKSIAENLAFSMKAKANSILHKTIIENIGAKGQWIPGPDGVDIWMPSGKTDVRLKNVKVQVANLSDVIKLDIGISSKFYTGEGFLGNLSDSELKGKFSSGSGGSIKEALLNIFPHSGERYLIYNFLAHSEHTMEINNLLATRQLLRLFSSSGISKDFSQYMLINGKVVSMWQIVKYAMSTDLLLSNSLLEKNSSQGVVISIQGRENFGKKGTFVKSTDDMTPAMAAWQRSREQNAVINKAKVTATLHLANLAKSVSGKI